MNAQSCLQFLRMAPSLDVTILELKLLARIAALDRAVSQDELIRGVFGKPERVAEALRRLMEGAEPAVRCVQGLWFIVSLKGLLPRNASNGAASGASELSFERDFESCFAEARQEVEFSGADHVRPGWVQAAAGGHHVDAAAASLSAQSSPRGGIDSPRGGIDSPRGGEQPSEKSNKTADSPHGGNTMTCKRHGLHEKHVLSMSWDPQRIFGIGDRELSGAEILRELRGLNWALRCPGCAEEWKSRIMENSAAVWELIEDARNAAKAKGPGWFNAEYLVAIGVKRRGPDGRVEWAKRWGQEAAR